MAIVLLCKPFVWRRFRCCCGLLKLSNRACPEKHALSLHRLAVEGAYNFTKKLVSGDKFNECRMLE